MFLKNIFLPKELFFNYSVFTLFVALVKPTQVPTYYNNPFQDNVPFLYPLNMSENPRFSDVFRGLRNKTMI